MKNPFSFYLSAFTSKGAFYFLPFTFFLGSCLMNPNMQKPGVKNLQGEWQQDSVPMEKKLINYSLYHLRFSCDSFFVSIKTFSKVNYGADTCTRTGQWTEYTRGHYEQRHDTLFLKGQFCNPDYTIKENPDCLRIGVYEEFFRISKKTDSLIQLSSISNVIPINARLIKTTTCTIKPL